MVSDVGLMSKLFFIYITFFTKTFNSFYMYRPNLHFTFYFYFTKSKVRVYLLMGQNGYQG